MKGLNSVDGVMLVVALVIGVIAAIAYAVAGCALLWDTLRKWYRRGWGAEAKRDLKRIAIRTGLVVIFVLCVVVLDCGVDKILLFISAHLPTPSAAAEEEGSDDVPHLYSVAISAAIVGGAFYFFNKHREKQTEIDTFGQKVQALKDALDDPDLGSELAYFLSSERERRYIYFPYNHDRPDYDSPTGPYYLLAKLKPDDPKAWYNLGVACEKQGQHPEAVAAYDRAVKLKPDYPEAWCNCIIYLRTHDSYDDRRSRAYRRWTELRPDDPDAWRSLGAAYENQREYDAAVAAYRQVIELKQSDPNAWFNLGRAYASQGKYYPAAVNYHMAVTLKPEFLEAWSALGESSAQQAKYDDAVAAYRQAIKLKPDDSHFWYMLGNSYTSQGKHDDAIGAYRQAVKLKPRNGEAWHRLGHYYHKQGKQLEALDALNHLRKSDSFFANEMADDLADVLSSGIVAEEKVAGEAEIARHAQPAEPLEPKPEAPTSAEPTIFTEERYNAAVARVKERLKQTPEESPVTEESAAANAQILMEAADRGDATAQHNLGRCYFGGEGVTQDYKEAAKWFRKAAEQGHAEAQVNLGHSYQSGWGVPRDGQEAVKWYRKAAEQGYALAQDTLGDCYHYGEGVAKDYQEAEKWYRKAAEQGNAVSQFNLGVIYGKLGKHEDAVTACQHLRTLDPPLADKLATLLSSK